MKSEELFEKIFDALDALDEIAENNNKSKLSIVERAILGNLDWHYHYIAREEDGNLYIYYKKPFKCGEWNKNGGHCAEFEMFNHLFKMVQWEDKEPTSIKDLLERGGGNRNGKI